MSKPWKTLEDLYWVAHYLTPRQEMKVAHWYKKGHTIGDIANFLGMNCKVVSASLRRTKILPLKHGHSLPMERNPAWKGGRTIDKHGYVLLLRKNHPNCNGSGYVREHRLVMEEILGRYLTKAEVVHHRNGNHSDNKPENLLLFADNSAHLAVELFGKVPRWTEEGLKRIQERSIPSMKGKSRNAKGTGVSRIRRKLIQKFLHETNQLEDIVQEVVLPSLPCHRKRKKKEH